MQYYENGYGQPYPTLEANTLCIFFYEKNNQGKQDIFTAIALFSKHGGRSGRSGKSGKYITFEKSGTIFSCFYHFL